MLSDFGLPDVRLWYGTVKRGAHTLPPVKAILHELGEIRSMRKQNPGKWADGSFNSDHEGQSGIVARRGAL